MSWPSRRTSLIFGLPPDSTDLTKEELAGAAVVYHAAAPPYHQWPERFPPLNASVVAAASAVAGAISDPRRT